MTPNSLSNFKKKEQSKKGHNTWYQTILQGHWNQNSLVLAEKQTYRPMEHNREPRNKPMKIWSVDIWQSRQEQKMVEKEPLQLMVLGDLDRYMQKKKKKKERKKLDHQLTPYTKINSRWIEDLNVIHDTIKFLEENIGRKISDNPLSSILIDTSPKARAIKERINKWVLMKIKSFCMAKENTTKLQREPTV